VPEVEVRASTRRRKTATAYWSDGRIIVLVPAHVRGARRTELVAWLVERALQRQRPSRVSDTDLAARAARLAHQYTGGVQPSSIRWVTNQRSRWGSCTAATGEIRLSHRLQGVPSWVLDGVIVHELAHLVHPDHSAAFHQLCDAYPRQQEATAYLQGLAFGLGAER
jgi:predicted metal-dependent hydrolase